MTRSAFLCGFAPDGFRQKNLISKHDVLKMQCGFSEKEIFVFPNGIQEFFLETILNRSFDSEVDEVILYFCTQTKAELSAKIIKLGENEIRKDVISYYSNLAKKIEMPFSVEYDFSSDFVSDEECGYKKIG